MQLQSKPVCSPDRPVHPHSSTISTTVTSWLSLLLSSSPASSLESSPLNEVVSEAFVRFFVEIMGHYSLFLTHSEREERTLQREAFRKSVSSKSLRRFLEVFMETQMFGGFIQERELRKQGVKG